MREKVREPNLAWVLGAAWRHRYRAILVLWAGALLLVSFWGYGGDPSGDGNGFPSRQLGSATSDSDAASTFRVGNMRCNRETQECQCMAGYRGASCERAICDQGCQHGQCLRPGYCTCEEGWKGRTCDQAVCARPCVHGRCLYPNFCRCETGFFGRRCDRQCHHGEWDVRDQRCDCAEGWAGRECNRAVCATHGCEHGTCIRPNRCECFSGWDGNNCTGDIVGRHVDDLLLGLSYRAKRWPALTVSRSRDPSRESDFDETWRYVRKWTSHLDDEWKFGRTRLANELPENDTLAPRLTRKIGNCVAVGNSGGLLGEMAGRVIDAHDAVLRYNDAPTKGYEDYVGTKTTFRLLNRKFGDQMIQRAQMKAAEKTQTKRKSRQQSRFGRETNLLWRAESYQQYTVLRRLLPEVRIQLISPQFLIPSFTFFKSVMQRMQDTAGMAWHGGQATPHGFVGIVLLIQICERVSVYGFDVPSPKAKHRYHYFDKLEPADVHANDFEFNVLRLLHSNDAIRLW